MQPDGRMGAGWDQGEKMRWADRTLCEESHATVAVVQFRLVAWVHTQSGMLDGVISLCMAFWVCPLRLCLRLA